MFVAEKSGLIKVFDSLSDTTPTLFADLRTKVHNFWDRGLLGLPLDPDFPAKPFVYVSYTHDAAIGGDRAQVGRPRARIPPGPTTNGCVVSGRLSRLQPTGTQAGPEQVLIEDWCQQFPSHSIGDLAFGADGALYATGGDGASFNYADYGQCGSPKNPCDDPPVPRRRHPDARRPPRAARCARRTCARRGPHRARRHPDPSQPGHRRRPARQPAHGRLRPRTRAASSPTASATRSG